MNDEHLSFDMVDPDYRDESAGCVGPIKIMYYALQIVLLVIGIVVLYNCASLLLTLMRGATDEDQALRSLLGYGVFIGILMVGLSGLGIVSVGGRSQDLGTLYILLIITSVFVAIFGVYYIQSGLEAVRADMPATWDGLSGASRLALQSIGRCCGFSSPDDRPGPSCPAAPLGAPLAGCFPSSGASPVILWLQRMLLISLALISFLGFVLCIINIFVLFVHDPKHSRHSRDPSAV